jgi:hypothetical protein
VPAAAACTQSSPKRKQAGLVQSVRHQLRVQRPRGTLQQARKKMPLFVGDLIQTTSKDAAAIRFCDGGTLYLNRQTEVVFGSPTQEQERYGEVVEQLTQQSTHRVQTATATASASGALFAVTTRQGRSTVVVAQGVVQVENGHGRVRVAANQQTVVLPDRAPQPPARSDAGRALSWTASVSGPSWKVVATFDPSYRPQRLEVNAQGFLYVVLIPPNGSQPADARIVKLSPNGKQVASWGLHAKDGELYGLGLDTQSNVYVTDTTHAQIEQFTPDGRFLRTIGPVGHDLPQFVRLHGVEVDAAGNLYVAEYVNGRVQKFSPGGQALKTFGTGAMEAPTDVALDAAGNIYVCEPPRQYIRELSPSGQTLKLWNSLGTSVGYLGRPMGVALDAAGTMYVADYDRHRILKLVR